MTSLPRPHRLEAIEPLAARLSATGLARMVAATVGLGILAAMLAGAIVLRTIDLAGVPAGFNQDEACNGYDAQCLLLTGRDQHGNRWPILMQAFNDYRMPLFDYSLMIPIRFLGLRPEAVRLGAALWGCADLIALAALATMLIGVRGAVIAVALAAVSPWHLPLSRFGHEAITAAATTTIGLAFFFAAIRTGRGRWLIVSALALAASLYSYAITKAFVPPMLFWMGVVYWRALKPMRRTALAALAIIILAALPQALALWHQPGAMARYHSVAVLGAIAWPQAAAFIGRSFLDNFDPGFLFVRGSPFLALHPPGFGQLLAAQAVMIGLALCALSESRYRRPVIFVLGWLAIAAVPAALIMPRFHPQHSILMVTPWMLLSGVGMVFLFDTRVIGRGLRLAAAGIILLIAIAQGARFVNFYFTRYPALAAYQFQYGLAPATKWLLHHAQDRPVVITDEINQPYIYVLFFGDYPPRRFQNEMVARAGGLFGTVSGFDRFYFGDPQAAYAKLAHGIFLFTGYEKVPAAPAFTVNSLPGEPEYAGRPAYQVLIK